MAKLVKLNRTYWRRDGYGHWCPGCGCGHEINTDKPTAASPSWRFDGNVAKPTFSPSVNIRTNGPEMNGYNPAYPTSVCHYFVKAGQLQFLDDCTHALKGKTVPMPDFPSDKWTSCERVG